GVQMTLQFEWNKWRAMETSMLLNTSPEFEMAVYTICALSGGECEMEINNQPVVIFASTIKQDDGLVIDQCYPATSGHKPTKKPVPPTKRPVVSTKRPRHGGDLQ
ncbi:hypothetical protein OSTOST_16860, partial [Ostertagia ostertagi]